MVVRKNTEAADVRRFIHAKCANFSVSEYLMGDIDNYPLGKTKVSGFHCLLIPPKVADTLTL